jgi:hypothetical protein
MTVKELIKLLQNYPSHEKIYIGKSDNTTFLMVAFTNPCIPIPELPNTIDKM